MRSPTSDFLILQWHFRWRSRLIWACLRQYGASLPLKIKCHTSILQCLHAIVQIIFKTLPRFMLWMLFCCRIGVEINFENLLPPQSQNVYCPSQLVEDYYFFTAAAFRCVKDSTVWSQWLPFLRYFLVECLNPFQMSLVSCPCLRRIQYER